MISSLFLLPLTWPPAPERLVIAIFKPHSTPIILPLSTQIVKGTPLIPSGTLELQLHFVLASGIFHSSWQFLQGCLRNSQALHSSEVSISEECCRAETYSQPILRPTIWTIAALVPKGLVAALLEDFKQLGFKFNLDLAPRRPSTTNLLA